VTVLPGEASLTQAYEAPWFQSPSQQPAQTAYFLTGIQTPFSTYLHFSFVVFAGLDLCPLYTSLALPAKGKSPGLGLARERYTVKKGCFASRSIWITGSQQSVYVCLSVCACVRAC
jgi:hypothetical protein